MATPDWTTVPDTNLEPGDPIRSIDIIAINNHAAAMAGGAIGAPKISLSAIEVLSAGTTIRSRVDTESVITIPANNPSPITISGGVQHSLGFMQLGTIRVTAQHKTSSSSATSTMYITRIRNGTQTVNQWSTTSTSYVTRTVDIDILPGDGISISHDITGTSFQSGYIRNARFQTNGENIWPGVSVRLENDYTVV